MTKPEEKKACRTPRWILVLLFASLALNLLIFGAIGAKIYKRHAYGPMEYAMTSMKHGKGHRAAAFGRPGLMLRASRRLLRRLPEERRRALRAIAASRREAIRAAYAEVGRARRALIEALAKEPFDEAAYAAAMERLRKADTAARMAVLDLSDAFLRALTPEERDLYARILRDMGEKRRFFRRR